MSQVVRTDGVYRRTESRDLSLFLRFVSDGTCYGLSMAPDTTTKLSAHLQAGGLANAGSWKVSGQTAVASFPLPRNHRNVLEIRSVPGGIVLDSRSSATEVHEQGIAYRFATVVTRDFEKKWSSRAEAKRIQARLEAGETEADAVALAAQIGLGEAALALGIKKVSRRKLTVKGLEPVAAALIRFGPEALLRAAWATVDLPRRQYEDHARQLRMVNASDASQVDAFLEMHTQGLTPNWTSNPDATTLATFLLACLQDPNYLNHPDRLTMLRSGIGGWLTGAEDPLQFCGWSA